MSTTPLSRVVGTVAGAAARRPKTTIALWFVLVAACVFVNRSTLPK